MESETFEVFSRSNLSVVGQITAEMGRYQGGTGGTGGEDDGGGFSAQ